ncbi:MAG: hypothetical protein RMI91_10895 [Gemmatales bacterium]|nr:hypothetical protein [Gemmatales bacterium]MDW7995149.1 hypothetical protein [Gemmatales bacterium]
MAEEIFQPSEEKSAAESRERETGPEPQIASSESPGASAESPRWPVRQIAVGVGMVLALALAGILIWQLYFPSPSQRLRDGEARFRAGQAARQQRHWDRAMSRFTAAVSAAEEVIRRLEQNRLPNASPTAEEEYWLGQAYWLRARALFGRTAAQIEQEAAQQQSSPPTALPGPDTPEVLELFMITDAETRREALNSLYRASRYLAGNLAVQREALKHRMNESFENWNWRHLYQLAQNIEQLNPEDDLQLQARAYYALALYHYHQPEFSTANDAGKPRAAERKERSAMKQAEQYLEKLASVEKPLRFRAVYLRAQVWHWLAEPRYQKPLPNPHEIKTYRQRLEQALFDPEHGLPGALGQQAQQQFETLSPMDMEGLFGLYRLALELLGRSAGTTAETSQLSKQRLVESALALLKRAGDLPEAKGSAAWRAIRETAQLFRALRAERDKPWWQDAVLQFEECSEKIATRFPQTMEPELCADLADLLVAVASATDKKNTKQLQACKRRGKDWVSRARQALDKVSPNEELKTRLVRLERALNQLP